MLQLCSLLLLLSSCPLLHSSAAFVPAATATTDRWWFGSERYCRSLRRVAVAHGTCTMRSSANSRNHGRWKNRFTKEKHECVLQLMDDESMLLSSEKDANLDVSDLALQRGLHSKTNLTVWNQIASDRVLRSCLRNEESIKALLTGYYKILSSLPARRLERTHLVRATSIVAELSSIAVLNVSLKQRAVILKLAAGSREMLVVSDVRLSFLYASSVLSKLRGLPDHETKEGIMHVLTMLRPMVSADQDIARCFSLTKALVEMLGRIDGRLSNREYNQILQLLLKFASIREDRVQAVSAETKNSSSSRIDRMQALIKCCGLIDQMLHESLRVDESIQEILCEAFLVANDQIKERLEIALGVMETFERFQVTTVDMCVNVIVRLARRLLEQYEESDVSQVAGLIERAMNRIRKMIIEDKLKPDVISLTQLIDTAGRHVPGQGIVELGCFLLENAGASKIPLDVILCNVLVNNIVRGQSQVDREEAIRMSIFEVKDLLYVMQDKSVTPDIYTVTMIIGLLKRFASVGRGDEAMKEADWVLTMMDRFDIAINDVFARQYADLCSTSCGQGADALLCLKLSSYIFDKLWETQPLCNATITSYLQVCCETASRGVRLSLKRGRSAFDLYVRGTTSTAVEPLNSLLDLIARSVGRSVQDGFALALPLAELERERGVQLDIVSFNTLIKVCVKDIASGHKGISNILVLLREMSKANIDPDLISVNSILNACSKSAAAGNPYAFPAASRIAQMIFNGSLPVQPDDFSFNSLLHTFQAHAKLTGRTAGCFAYCREILSIMDEMGVPPTAPTFALIISSSEIEGTPDAVDSSLAMFHSVPQKLKTRQTFMAMMKSLMKVGRNSEVMELLDESASSGLKPNVYMYSAAFKACKTADSLKWVLDHMAKNRVELNANLRRQVDKISQSLRLQQRSLPSDHQMD